MKSVAADVEPRRDIDQMCRANPDSTNDHASGLTDQIPDEGEAAPGSSRRQKSSKDSKRNFPQKRHDQTVFRLKKMIVEIQQHEDYQEAMDTLILTCRGIFWLHKDHRQRQSTRCHPLSPSVKCSKSALWTQNSPWKLCWRRASMDDMFDAADPRNNDPIQ